VSILKKINSNLMEKKEKEIEKRKVIFGML